MNVVGNSIVYCVIALSIIVFSVTTPYAVSIRAAGSGPASVTTMSLSIRLIYKWTALVHIQGQTFLKTAPQLLTIVA